MLDRVTHRKDMRDELITIVRMLLGMTPPVMGDLPSPDKAAAKKADTPDELPADKAAEK